MDHDGSVLKATIPGVFLPRAGHAALAFDAARSLLRVSLPGPERARRPLFFVSAEAGGCGLGFDKACKTPYVGVALGPAVTSVGRSRPLMGEDDMFNNIGPAGLLLIAVVVLVLFGRGKIAGLMGEVGKGITSFKRGVKEGTDGDRERLARRRRSGARRHAREGQGLTGPGRRARHARHRLG